ncbi:DUF58 domain-containing protein [Thiosulfativibrio zosterae]|uniref:DUF58 domain-containing protein n=1 Tax=Thiosulfativibrio zosterae TaxID=2675053 RepID=A0A6F8PJX2_9GAMM|nr:DUF58 domain-containing protein [Thiosulfativibrio zosterae]BBP42357.1 hypothetical protein THMIRHAT_01030 [Thiosulfativibrio zosterae]
MATIEWRSWAQRGWQALLRRSAWQKAFHHPAHDPIMSSAQIKALGAQLSLMPKARWINPYASEARKQGEQASRYLGSGLEYEESRPYQLGDEVRRIHWRLLAKTGQAYTKLFQEERQAGWTLMVDQRAAMRFGTQRQLKVTQALNAAGYFAWQAQQAGLSMDVIRLAQQSEHSASFEGRGLFESILHFLAIPCPPISLSASQPEVRLLDELLDCQQHLLAGSRLVIISDLADFDEATGYALAQLQQKVAVQVVLISDPAEHELPSVAGLKLQGLLGEQLTLSIEQRDTYQRWAKQYFDDKIKHLQTLGVTWQHLSTEQDVSVLLNDFAKTPTSFLQTESA